MEGLLVMADISGYTKFVAGTEAEHSREILAELMDGIAKSFGGRLAIDQVEGDALACTTERTDVEVVDWLRETFRLFHGRLRDIRTATTCPCRACATVQDLGLKFIVHRGEFSRYEVAGRVQLHGNDVNVVHRLLKNTVPLREYVLATAAAQTSWPESLRGQLIAAPQTYDVGAVDAAYLDLRPVRDSVWNEPRPKVDPASAKIRGTVRYPGTPEQVFRYFTDASLRKLWMGVPRVDFVPGARGSLVGAEYHCIHGENQKTVFKVLDSSAPNEITMQMDFPLAGTVWRTDRIEAEGPATTRVDTAIAWQAHGIKASLVDFMVRRMLLEYGAVYNKRVAEMLAVPDQETSTTSATAVAVATKASLSTSNPSSAAARIPP
ncbi:MAG: DUF2652 domain-containing protein [Chloroflexi bacterium]|nr:MAG: DUF2652 domain-containing protein [Chloroflexota bacterium]